jgi:hypothetical protein
LDPDWSLIMEIYQGAHGFANEVANCIMVQDGPSHGSIIPGGIEAISSGNSHYHPCKECRYLKWHMPGSQ